MKNKILTGLFTILISISTMAQPAQAGLWSYFNDELGQSIPSRDIRAAYAEDIGIEDYSGTASQNIALEAYLREVHTWEAKVISGAVTDEELEQVPERVWKRLVPQVIQTVSPAEDLEDGLLGFGDPIITQEITCLDTECDKYLSNEEQSLGFSVVSRYRTTLQSSMTNSQTTVPVSSIVTFDGHTLTMADLGSQVYLTIEPGASREEIVKCTSITSSQWSGCTRGLAFYGSSEASVSNNQKAHNAGSIVVMSNVHYVYENLIDNDSNQTVTGTIKYAVYPEVLAAAGNATTSRQLITLGQAQLLQNQGAATSTETVAGIAELATQIEMASTTDLGVDRPLVLQAKYATSTCQTVGLYTVITENDGKIAKNCVDQTENYSWTGLNTFTATTTFTTTTMASTTATALNVTTINNKPASDLLTSSTTPALEYHFHPAIQTSGAASRAINLTGFQRIEHNLGVVPSYITFNGYAETDNAGTVNYAYSNGSYTSTTLATAQSNAHFVLESGGTNNSAAGTNTTGVLTFIDLGTSVDASAVVVAPTSTTFFYLNWTQNANTGDTRVFTWTAFK